MGLRKSEMNLIWIIFFTLKMAMWSVFPEVADSSNASNLSYTCQLPNSTFVSNESSYIDSSNASNLSYTCQLPNSTFVSNESSSKGTNVSNTTAIRGADVVLNCTVFPDIISLTWKVNTASLNCYTALQYANSNVYSNCTNERLSTSCTTQWPLHISSSHYNDAGNYTCEIVYSAGTVKKIHMLSVTDPSFETSATTSPSVFNKLQNEKTPYIILGSVSAIFLLSLVLFIFIYTKHLEVLRNCCKSRIPSRIVSIPMTTTNDDLEPYASYVNKVNTIYSTAGEARESGIS
ncbi:uncharacterized protein LOC122802456 [Protopterus annectens]|uniref:uncharacterized protein LOC122802456 n=1 Tax=Protopterus annectens TaxID=7888 RepID=UPI001CFA00E6|nr:uncharacterized protein LOC122802456 [Protopterus annectens]